MEVVLARHGEIDWNLNGRPMGQKDVLLNDKGREQAEVLRNKLANMSFDCCCSPPLNRAKETAEIICKIFRLSFCGNFAIMPLWKNHAFLNFKRRGI